MIYEKCFPLTYTSLSKLWCSTCRCIQMKSSSTIFQTLCNVNAHVKAKLYRGKCRYRFCLEWLGKLSLNGFQNRLRIAAWNPLLSSWGGVAYIIFLWISISADTSQRCSSSDEMQMGWVRKCKSASAWHGHNEGDSARLFRIDPTTVLW